MSVSSSGSLSSFRPIIWLLFPHWPTLGPFHPGTFPWGGLYLSAHMDLEVKASWGTRLDRAWRHPLTLDPQGAFLCMHRLSLVPKRGSRDLNPLFKQNFAPLCPCHDCYLKVFPRDKHCLYPVSVVTSNLEGKQEADCKCLSWSPPSPVPGNANRRLVVNI